MTSGHGRSQKVTKQPPWRVDEDIFLTSACEPSLFLPFFNAQHNNSAHLDLTLAMLISQPYAAYRQANKDIID